MTDVLLTVLIVLIAFSSWRVRKNILWLTGSMETYQAMQLRLAVREKDEIEFIWWDPTIEEVPVIPEHDSEVTTDKIYLFVPPKYRKLQPSL